MFDVYSGHSWAIIGDPGSKAVLQAAPVTAMAARAPLSEEETRNFLDSLNPKVGQAFLLSCLPGAGRPGGPAAAPGRCPASLCAPGEAPWSPGQPNLSKSSGRRYFSHGSRAL